jgi:hypothetical protein
MDEGTTELGERKRNVTRIGRRMVGCSEIGDPLRERGRLLQRHRIEGVGQRLLVPQTLPRHPRWGSSLLLLCGVHLWQSRDWLLMCSINCIK